MFSYIRFQINRKNRRLKRKMAIWRVWLAHYLDRHVYGAWRKLGSAQAMFLAWSGIILFSLVGIILNFQSIEKHYMTSAPSKGGVYSEGLAGTVSGVNPLFPDNSATSDVVSLVFSGLTRVDQDREVVSDLAESWEVSTDRKTYTFVLRPNLRWQDNTALTTADVAFTINRLQNPDTRSPLSSNWSGVRYEIKDERTIVFSLPTSYSSFLSNTTVGILPKHLLENVRPSLLRTHEFNQRPVGSGPFRLQQIHEGQSELVLLRNESYYLGAPYLEKFRFVLYPSGDDFIDGYARAQINGFVFSKPQMLERVSKIGELKVHTLNLPVYTGLFFNSKSPQLSDVKLRQALAYSIDRASLIHNQLSDQASATYYPILAGYPGYDPSLPKYSFSADTAKQLAEQIGSDKLGSTNITIATLKDSQYEAIARAIKPMWERLGVRVEIIAVPANQLQQSFIRPRNYDVLLYGQGLGIDADTYGYWHSSQSSDPGLNLSQYSNAEADKLLESGRIAKDPTFKASRYQAFLSQWTKDVPAIILYTPNYFYAQSVDIDGFSARKLVELSNRFYDVQKWYINTMAATKASQGSE